jgi:hypothetical protein
MGKDAEAAVAYFEIYENQSRENYGKTENTRLPCLKED